MYKKGLEKKNVTAQKEMKAGEDESVQDVVTRYLMEKDELNYTEEKTRNPEAVYKRYFQEAGEMKEQMR